MKTLPIVLSLLFPLHVSAQVPEPPPLEYVLVPVKGAVDGPFGARWIGELVTANRASRDVVFGSGSPYCVFTGCGPFHIISGDSVRRDAGGRKAGPNLGEIWFVERAYAGFVHFSLRAREERTPSWGTSIPVIREHEFFSEAIELLNIPTDARFRQNLRVYDPLATDAASVRLVVLSSEAGASQVIGETLLQLRDGAKDGPYPYRPSFASIPNLAEFFPQVRSVPTVRLRLEPLTPGLRYWAFVSVTENSTNHVTAITPE